MSGDANAEGTKEPFRYRAFLSYRTADRRLAEKLHRALEGYRIPRQLVGRTTAFGVVGEKVGAIFRDRDDARTEEDIETIVARELSKSQHLIVLCTPRTREPASWVSREITLFRQRRADGKIHAVIGDGEPPHCFPEALLATDDEGRPRTPLAADIRQASKGGQDGFDRAVVKLVAGLTGLDFDELWQRERRRHRQRRITMAGVALASATAVSLAATIWLAYLSVDRHLTIANDAQARGRWDAAALAAAAAVDAEQWLGPLGENSAHQRLAWLRGHGRVSALLLGHIRPPKVGVLGDRVLTGGLDGRVLAWDLSAAKKRPLVGEPVHRFIGPVLALQLSPSGDRVLALAESGAVTVIEMRTGMVTARLDSQDNMIRTSAFAELGQMVLVGRQDGTLELLSASTLQQVKHLARTAGGLIALTVSQDGSRYAFASDGKTIGSGLIRGDLPVQSNVSENINDLVFDHRTGKLIASSDTSADVYEAHSLKRLQTFTWQDLAFTKTVVGSSGQIALSLATGETAWLWTVSTGDKSAQLLVDGCRPTELFKMACRASEAIALPGGVKRPSAFAVGYWDGAIRLWAEDGTLVGELLGHVARVSNLTVSADGQRLLSMSDDGSARVWQLDSPQEGRDLLRAFCAESEPALISFSTDDILGKTLRSQQAAEIEPGDLSAFSRSLRLARSPCR